MYSITRDRSALIAVRINKFCKFLKTNMQQRIQTHPSHSTFVMRTWKFTKVCIYRWNVWVRVVRKFVFSLVKFTCQSTEYDISNNLSADIMDFSSLHKFCAWDNADYLLRFCTVYFVWRNHDFNVFIQCILYIVCLFDQHDSNFQPVVVQ